MKSVTDAVLNDFGGEDDRLRTVLSSAVRHLHAFVAEVDLSREEMEATLRFLDAVSAANTDSHNEGVLLADVLGVSSLICDQSHRDDMALLGPFWRINSPEVEFGGSITRGKARGPQMRIEGQVRDSDGNPLPDVIIHVWQASPHGMYENQDPDQPDMNLRGRLRTNGDGRFSVLTTKPAGYPVPTSGPTGKLLHKLDRHPFRPAHVHFLLEKPGFETLITQIFDPTDKYIESDAVYGVRSALIGNFTPVDPANAEAGYILQRDFVLHPGESKLPVPPIK